MISEKLKQFRRLDLMTTEWEHVLDDIPLLEELNRELVPEHVLYGQEMTVIARKFANDDILVLLNTHENYLVGVHLTWSNHPEPDPQWPSTWFYRNIDEFVEEELSAS